MRALVFLRLWPLWLIGAAVLTGFLLLRRGKSRPPQTPNHGRPSAGDPDVEPASARPARPAAVSTSGVLPGIELPDFKMPVDDGTEEELDKGVWLQLCDVLNGQGQGQHAHLLQKDGRFRTREGGRYTLYRATGKLNGAEQDICVIVRIDMDGHVTARRIIVSLKQPLVLFVNEERDESPDCPKGISKEQATNTDPSGLHPMPSTAVMLLRYKLMQATRAGNL